MQRFVYIDTDECIGCESRVELCPEILGLNPEVEKAEVILPEGASKFNFSKNEEKWIISAIVADLPLEIYGLELLSYFRLQTLDHILKRACRNA